MHAALAVEPRPKEAWEVEFETQSALKPKEAWEAEFERQRSGDAAGGDYGDDDDTQTKHAAAHAATAAKPGVTPAVPVPGAVALPEPEAASALPPSAESLAAPLGTRI